jgi:hypothetical protein
VSRGPGKWQRAVLELVDEADGAWVPVDTVWLASTVPEAERSTRPLRPKHEFKAFGFTVEASDEHWLSVDLAGARAPRGSTFTLATREAIRRAMRTLAVAGKVEIGNVIANERLRLLYGETWNDGVRVLAARRP